ncbi:unnamed protein product, partial [Vitrella brassicaformis CCMP3155]
PFEVLRWEPIGDGKNRRMPIERLQSNYITTMHDTWGRPLDENTTAAGGSAGAAMPTAQPEGRQFDLMARQQQLESQFSGLVAQLEQLRANQCGQMREPYPPMMPSAAHDFPPPMMPFAAHDFPLPSLLGPPPPPPSFPHHPSLGPLPLYSPGHPQYADSLVPGMPYHTKPDASMPIGFEGRRHTGRSEPRGRGKKRHRQPSVGSPQHQQGDSHRNVYTTDFEVQLIADYVTLMVTPERRCFAAIYDALCKEPPDIATADGLLKKQNAISGADARRKADAFYAEILGDKNVHDRAQLHETMKNIGPHATASDAAHKRHRDFKDKVKTFIKKVAREGDRIQRHKDAVMARSRGQTILSSRNLDV